MQDPKVIVALDYSSKKEALAFVDLIDPNSCRLKVGKEMFTLFGPEFVRALHQRGHSVFLDLKFHDIPNTCAKAVAAAADLGVWMVNVHASGGQRMLTAAKEALSPFGKDAPLLIGVTVLTSMSQDDLLGVGITSSIEDQVVSLASLVKDSGLDGVVCSAQEALTLKTKFGPGFKLITPGIRPIGSQIGDQKRVMTPIEAINQGVNYLVIGRPITQASEPAKVLAEINQTIY